jgi:hypothetical protein
MIDAEVLRLRKMRHVALRARALAKALESNPIDSAAFAESAVICWTIARIASGTLRAHPYLSYQKGPNTLRAAADRAIASLAAWIARLQGRSYHVFSAELQCVAREVSDVRALTWLPDLSDALGRVQLRLRRLGVILDAASRSELGTAAKPTHAVSRAEITGATRDGATVSDWPYLAI